MSRPFVAMFLAALVGCVEFTGGETSGGVVTVSFVSPPFGALVSQSLAVELATVRVEANDEVDLYLDEAFLGTMAFPYRDIFDVTSLSEGSHSLKVSVRRGHDVIAEAGPRNIVIDHEAPAPISVSDSHPCLTNQPLRIQFSEALAEDSVGVGSVVLVGSESGVLEANAHLAPEDPRVVIAEPDLARGAETIKVFLSDEIRDLAGNRVDPSIPIEFVIGSFQNTPQPFPPGLSIIDVDYGNGVEPWLLARDGGGLRVFHRFENTWGSVGVDLITGEAIESGSIRVKASGIPFFMYPSYVGTYAVQAGYWNGYVYYQSQVASDAIPLDDGLVVSPDGDVFVGTQSWINWDISIFRLKQILPIQWELVGTPIPQFAGTGPSTLTVDSSGNPVVMTRDAMDPQSPFIAWRWDGASWTPIGDSLGSPYGPGTACLFEGNLFVAYPGNPTDEFEWGDLHVSMWDGVEWSSRGKPIFDAWGLRGGSPEMACLPTGPLVVSVANGIGPYFEHGTFAAQLQGSEWIPIGCNQEPAGQEPAGFTAMTPIRLAPRADGSVGVLFSYQPQPLENPNNRIPLLKEATPQ